uniref:Uncharacterized protein n=1 Tax=Acrobeloides nanus TaxID=290746 RepID=A0A914BVX6_9BILA
MHDSGSDSDYSGASLATILLPDSDYVSDSEFASVSSWCSEIDIGSIAPQTARSGSLSPPRRRDVVPTLVPFTIVSEKPDVAQAQVMLSNLSDKIINFKFKSLHENRITAYPSGSGSILPHGVSKCYLSWQLPENLNNVTEMLPKRLLLITSAINEDVAVDGNERMKTTSTRLLACLTTKENEINQNKKQVFLLDIHGYGQSVNMKEQSVGTAVVAKRSELLAKTQKDVVPSFDCTEYLPAASISITVFVILLMAYFFNHV